MVVEVLVPLSPLPSKEKFQVLSLYYFSCVLAFVREKLKNLHDVYYAIYLTECDVEVHVRFEHLYP